MRRVLIGPRLQIGVSLPLTIQWKHPYVVPGAFGNLRECNHLSVWRPIARPGSGSHPRERFLWTRAIRRFFVDLGLPYSKSVKSYVVPVPRPNRSTAGA